MTPGKQVVPGMRISRRKAFHCLIGTSAMVCMKARASSTHIAIVTASRELPHLAALEAVQTALAAQGITVATFRLPADDAAFRQEVSSGVNQLAIAVGMDAVRAVASANARIPVLATMVFRADAGNTRSPPGAETKLAGAVWLDLPVSAVAAGLRLAFPDTTKLAVIRDSSEPQSSEAALHAHQLPPGVTVRSVTCGSSSELLTTMRTLRGQVEFVICLPDSKLYNKTTVEPLILASLEHKLPLVGYSASFVRAGAAVGVYPDFADIGRQTAALVDRCLNNPATIHEESPRRTTTAVNERVMHLLGRNFRSTQSDQVVVIR